MANKGQVQACLISQPEWTVREIAGFLRCQPEYVRATIARNGWRKPPSRSRRPISPPKVPVTKLHKVSRAMFELLLAVRNDVGADAYHREIDLIRTRIEA